MNLQNLSLGMLIFLLFYLQTSCVKKDEINGDIIRNLQTKEIYVGDTFLLPSGSKQQNWTSTNKFVGTINQDGVFTALHIGKTKLKAKSKESNSSIEIKVLPKITDIPEPVIGFGENIHKIKELENRPISNELVDVLSMKINSPYVESLYYLFNQGKCAYAVMKFMDITESKLDYILSFFDERYEYLGLFNIDHYYTDQKRKILIAISSEDKITARYTIYQDKIK